MISVGPHPSHDLIFPSIFSNQTCETLTLPECDAFLAPCHRYRRGVLVSRVIAVLGWKVEIPRLELSEHSLGIKARLVATMSLRYTFHRNRVFSN
jgi:hypothetical protein